MSYKVFVEILSHCTTLVRQLTYKPKLEGSNPTLALGERKTAKNRGKNLS